MNESPDEWTDFSVCLYGVGGYINSFASPRLYHSVEKEKKVQSFIIYAISLSLSLIWFSLLHSPLFFVCESITGCFASCANEWPRRSAGFVSFGNSRGDCGSCLKKRHCVCVVFLYSILSVFLCRWCRLPLSGPGFSGTTRGRLRLVVGLFSLRFRIRPFPKKKFIFSFVISR